jgi:hypothetical protein
VISVSLSAAFIKPFLAFTIQPNAFALDACRVFIEADPALFSFYPASIVFASILPDKFALAMALIFFEFADVLFAIWPD